MFPPLDIVVEEIAHNMFISLMPSIDSDQTGASMDGHVFAPQQERRADARYR